MRGFAMTAMLVLAASGLSACNRNKAANNTATANTAAPAPAAPAAPMAAPAAGAGMDPAAFRAAIAEQCVLAARGNPNVPASVDLAGACGCATEATLAGRSDPFAFTQTPEGQQVFNQALTQCLQQAGAIPGAAPEGVDEAEGGDEARE